MTCAAVPGLKGFGPPAAPGPARSGPHCLTDSSQEIITVSFASEWAGVTPRQNRRSRASPGTARLASDPPKIDTSQSAKEWGWVCGRLENGLDAFQTYRLLVEGARGRRRGDVGRYARRTVQETLVHVGRSDWLS